MLIFTFTPLLFSWELMQCNLNKQFYLVPLIFLPQPLPLTFPLSHLECAKHFVHYFLHDQLLHLLFEYGQDAIIGLMVSVTASSWQCGTNEPSGSGFQHHSIGSGMLDSISLILQKEPAWIHARFMCWRIPDGDGTIIWMFTLGLEMRWSVCHALKGACFFKPYGS